MAIAIAFAVGCGGGGGTADDPEPPDASPTCADLDDGNACTIDTCETGVAIHTAAPVGAPCDGGVCTATSACVECLADDDCTGGDVCDEANTTCVAPTCDDGEQNGSETDIDCGGGCAPKLRCADLAGCAIADDCQSGVCDGAACVPASCGDGVPQPGETCDDGNQTNGDGCDDGVDGTCRPTGCGNGTITGAEACDDGNAVDGDGCDSNCTVTACGNGVIAGTEECDDQDTEPDDGCDASCLVESGYVCDMVPSQCGTQCGDGIVAGAEPCDDPAPAEDGDGCSLGCEVEAGWTCDGSPSTCAPVCGDGVIVGAEACDDVAPAEDGDGCSATCEVEAGWTCDGASPTMCTESIPPGCGDGTITSTEQCDDGNNTNGDRCSELCRIEATCDAGQVLVRVLSADVPKELPDLSTATSIIPIASAGVVRSVRVGIGRLDHRWIADMDIALIAPDGERRVLMNDRGSSGDNLRNTLFDDAAATAISATPQPFSNFTGPYRPETTLSDAAGFNGRAAQGTWTLEVNDDEFMDGGVLESWTLLLCVEPPA